MSHHGREGERDLDDIRECHACNNLGRAIELIKALANGHGEDGANGSYATGTPAQICDAWLDRNGYESKASERKQRERRAAELDAQIEKLRAERSKL